MCVGIFVAQVLCVSCSRELTLDEKIYAARRDITNLIAAIGDTSYSINLDKNVSIGNRALQAARRDHSIMLHLENGSPIFLSANRAIWNEPAGDVDTLVAYGSLREDCTVAYFSKSGFRTLSDLSHLDITIQQFWSNNNRNVEPQP
jgi:hypothetical protein